MPVDEAQEDLEDQQPHLRVLVQREGQQRLQEGAGQRRQHVGGLETGRHLEGTFRDSKSKKERKKRRERERERKEATFKTSLKNMHILFYAMYLYLHCISIQSFDCMYCIHGDITRFILNCSVVCCLFLPLFACLCFFVMFFFHC